MFKSTHIILSLKTDARNWRGLEIDNRISPRYGQSFLCISMSIAELPKVARQLLYSWPCIYEYEVSNTFRNNYEDLDLALQGEQSDTRSNVFWKYRRDGF